MGRERTRQPLTRMSEINLTPLIDLTFLLLIAFIITFPMLEQGINVKLPRGKADRIDQQRSQNVSVNLQGQLFFNNRPTTLAELQQTLTGLIAKDADTMVLIRGDERLNYGRIVEVLRVLHKARVVRMALVTEGAD